MDTLVRILARLQEQAPHLDIATLLTALDGQTSSQEAFRKALKANIFHNINARFAATKGCSGDKRTARHAADALTDSDKPLTLPPANLGNIGWVLMDHAYPPCTTGLDDLLSMMLKDLIMGSHHRGKFVLVELVKIILISDLELIMGVRDTAGGVERLKINTVCVKMYKVQQWLQKGRWLIIKEPFFTLNEKKETDSPCIRIDHPSDLLDAHRLPDTVVGERSAQLCREAGNAAFVRDDLVTSHDCYTEGLNVIVDHPEQQDEVIKQDLHRKRTHIRLKLGRYEGAIADVAVSFSKDSGNPNRRLNAQTCFRAASAAYNLKRFDKASQLLQKQLEFSSEAKDGKELLARTNARIHEQSHGIYDVQTIKSSCATQQRVDAADYFVHTAIKATEPGRGRGLYATKDLAAGELILAETAFSCVSGGENSIANGWSARRPHELHRSLVGLWSSLVQEIGNNPEEAQRFLDLRDASDGIGLAVNEIDDTPVVDTFQMYDIMSRHAFPLDDIGPANSEKRDGSAIFVRTSYINHACIPNSARIFIGDFVMVHAIKPIAKG